MTLPEWVVQKDHELVSAAEKTQMETAEHRWHWTLDESNAERVSLREYAKRVNRSHSVIKAFADGYATWVVGARRPLAEEISRAQVGAEKEAKIEAVSEATGKTFSNVKSGKNPDVKKAMEAATHAVGQAQAQAAEEGKTLTTEEIKATAKKAAEAQVAAPTEVINMEKYTETAVCNIRNILENLLTVDITQFTVEHRELMDGELRSIAKSASTLAGMYAFDADSALSAWSETS